MNLDSNLPRVFWTVLRFDKRKENPLPLENRQLKLDWSLLSEDEKSEALRILEDQAREFNAKPSPDGFDEEIVTVTRGVENTDLRMVKFRRYFVSSDESAFDPRLPSPQFVDVFKDYVEDENGNEISDYEMMQIVSGEEKPIVLGNVETITKLGPTSPIDVENWTTTKTNTIAHFLQVVKQICESSWCKNPLSISHRNTIQNQNIPGENETSVLIQALFPDDEQTAAVVAYFRQLHAGDELLIKACNTYLDHCSHGGKKAWIEHEKNQFIGLVDSEPHFFQVGATRREILQMFMYGARLLHSESKWGDDEKLKELIEIHGSHLVVTAFNHCLWDFLSPAARIHAVIQQDYLSWVNGGTVCGPEISEIANLFERKREDLK